MVCVIIDGFCSNRGWSYDRVVVIDRVGVRIELSLKITLTPYLILTLIATLIVPLSNRGKFAYLTLNLT